MARELYLQLHDKKVLIAGAGITGLACAKALLARGAIVSIVDEKVAEHKDFTLIKLSAIDFSDFDLLLVSPGWREDHPVIRGASAAGIPIINEIDLAWSLKKPAQKWLALTGTNGKTSTVELAAAMLRSGGLSASACGNVGTTVIESVESLENFSHLVIELSSFQLHWLEDAEFVACAILNIAEDHLDWHGSFAAYAAEKLSILNTSMTAILNGDDSAITTRSVHWQGRKVFYSLDTPAPGELGIVEGLLIDRAFVADPQEAAMIAELGEVIPTVPHNVSNTLAAAGLARTVGISHESIREAVKKFSPGRHRIEKIYEADGISWINDSKATNPHAASASIMSALSVIWIAGGLAKGATMHDLVSRIKSRVRIAILIGADRELIATQIQEQAPDIEIIRVEAPTGYLKDSPDNSLMEAVVRAAKEQAKPGDSVLLAPACASMDQFISYSDRGDRFRSAVEKVVKDGK